MGQLDEPGLNRLIERGCPVCGGKKLHFRTYVDGRMPFMGGEPVGRVTWIYDGEKFVDGVFHVTCGDCAQVMFQAQADACPRCHAAGGLTRALQSTNEYPVPAACPSCDEDEVTYFAFLPAEVAYHDGRAGKALSRVEPHEPGFHGYRADCRYCGTIAARTATCPLCHAPGPLRARPG
jgi:RNA polymerase subunit RPABC4/transcription elongation factor Spt4